MGFLDSKATNISDVGGTWTARITAGSRSHIGGEVAYVGTAQSLKALGVDSKATLLSNGAEGNLRFNILTGMWQPYLAAGLGWQHYNVVNTNVNTSSVADSGDVAEFPLAAGMAFRYQGFVTDGRVQFHPAIDNNRLLPNTNLSTWDITARVGFEF